MQNNNMELFDKQDFTLHAEDKRVEVNLGYACNNHCVFCSESLNRVSEKASEARKTLTTEFLIDSFQKLYEKGFKHITFLGGEPTIRRDFLQLVKACSEIGYENIFLTSNGRMLARPNFAAALFKSGVNRLYLSIHGSNAEVHDRCVQASGAFEQVVAGIKQLKKHNLPFQISSVITRYNLTDLPALFEKCSQLGAERLFWAFVRPIGGAFENFDEIVPTFTELEPFLYESLSLAENSESPLTVAHIPLCRMSGFEKYVDELYWNEAAINREVFCIDEFKKIDENVDGRIVTKGHRKIKHPGCIDCRYVRICEGILVEYGNRHGFDEFIPVQGDIVSNCSTLQDARLANK